MSGELALVADSHSLHVLEGAGGTTGLTEDDKVRIERAIDDDVLKGCAIEFRSTEVVQSGDVLHVHGELELAGERQEIMFEVTVSSDGRVTGLGVCGAAHLGNEGCVGDLRTAAGWGRGARRLRGRCSVDGAGRPGP